MLNICFKDKIKWIANYNTEIKCKACTNIIKKKYFKKILISFIYYNIYVVVFTWLFTYKSPEICQVFRQVYFLIIWCHYVVVLPPANRCIADHGFEYGYIAPFKPTHERAIISCCIYPS